MNSLRYVRAKRRENVRYPKLREQVQIGGITVDLRMVIALCVTTYAVMIPFYHQDFSRNFLARFGLQEYGNRTTDYFVLFFVVPFLTILLMGDSPAEYGFRLGRWKVGLKWLAVLYPLILIQLLIFVPGHALEGYYRNAFGMGQAGGSNWYHFGKVLYATGAIMFTWEFLLRGFCLFALARSMGPAAAIFVQMVPFAVIHVSKPELETMATVLYGVVFGTMAWHAKSFLYPFLAHWSLMLTMLTISNWNSVLVRFGFAIADPNMHGRGPM